MTAWYIEKGPESDVVISSRVRIARNISEYPFPFRMDREQQGRVVEKLRDIIFNSPGNAKKYVFVKMQDLNALDRLALMEKHLISPELAENSRESGAIISKDEKISIMINEEDHLRVQCLFPGMQLENAWKLGEKIDTMLEEKLEFAFDTKLGYLTCCPTNIGTGVRASVMLHLPALVMTGFVNGVLESCGKLGIAVRGLHGENSEAAGNMFQVSNQITIGQSEEEIINNITNIAYQVIEQERLLRKEIHKKDPYRFEDKIYRSFGIFSNARIMTTEESLKLLSDIRLGVDMGIIGNVSIETLNSIMLLIQPGNLQKSIGSPLEPNERDYKRAELIREKLNKSQV